MANILMNVKFQIFLFFVEFMLDLKLEFSLQKNAAENALPFHRGWDVYTNWK
jgi:hypothetical protein